MISVNPNKAMDQLANEFVNEIKPYSECRSGSIIDIINHEKRHRLDPAPIVIYPVKVGEDIMYYTSFIIRGTIVGNICINYTFNELVRELSYGLHRAEVLNNNEDIKRKVYTYPELGILGDKMEDSKLRLFKMPHFSQYSFIRDDSCEDVVIA